MALKLTIPCPDEIDNVKFTVSADLMALLIELTPIAFDTPQNALTRNDANAFLRALTVRNCNVPLLSRRISINDVPPSSSISYSAFNRDSIPHVFDYSPDPSNGSRPCQYKVLRSLCLNRKVYEFFRTLSAIYDVDHSLPAIPTRLFSIFTNDPNFRIGDLDPCLIDSYSSDYYTYSDKILTPDLTKIHGYHAWIPHLSLSVITPTIIDLFLTSSHWRCERISLPLSTLLLIIGQLHPSFQYLDELSDIRIPSSTHYARYLLLNLMHCVTRCTRSIPVSISLDPEPEPIPTNTTERFRHDHQSCIKAFAYNCVFRCFTQPSFSSSEFP